MSSSEGTEDTAAGLEALADELNVLFGETVFPNTPHHVYDPIHYVLEHGGKRVRPMLVLLASRLADVSNKDAYPAALAVQLFHDFSLVHDDIMDNADERRGRPSVYRKFDAASAILSGDMLLCLAYNQLSNLPDDAIQAAATSAFTRMAIRVCEGQALDAELAEMPAATIDDYLQMIDGKTAALLEACLEMGGLIADLPEASIVHLKQVGNSIGRAFQIQDDLLDIVADSASWGKPVGGDLVEGKRTYPVLKGFERAGEAERPWFEAYFSSNGISFEEVEEARELLDRLGALDATRDEVDRYTQLAIDNLNELPQGAPRDMLRALIDRLGGRSH